MAKSDRQPGTHVTPENVMKKMQLPKKVRTAQSIPHDWIMIGLCWCSVLTSFKPWIITLHSLYFKIDPCNFLQFCYLLAYVSCHAVIMSDFHLRCVNAQIMAHQLIILTGTKDYLSLSKWMITDHVWPLPTAYVPVNPLLSFGNN